MRLLAAILLLASSARSQTAAADPALLQLAPPDAVFVAGFHAEKLKSSSVVQRLLTRARSGTEDFGKLVAAAGFDPERDVREVLIASGPIDANALIAVRGTFDPSKFSPLPKGKAVLLDPTTLLVGDEKALQAAMGRRQSEARLAPEFIARVESYSSRYDAWLLTTDSPTRMLAGQMQNQTLDAAVKGDLFQAIRHVSAGLRAGDSLELEGEMLTRSPKDAIALADVARFLTQLLMDSAASRGVSEAPKFEPDGASLRFAVKLPAPLLLKIFDTAAPRKKTP
ncbi:MAG: hypothetical protein ACRD44_15985 [Bryobacteraceae bacterium]